MNPFSRKNKGKRSDKKKRQIQEELKEHISIRNLEGLSEKDKERASGLMYELYDPYYSTRGSESEIRQIEMLNTIVEQNWLIIKLLNEINQK